MICQLCFISMIHILHKVSNFLWNPVHLGYLRFWYLRNGCKTGFWFFILYEILQTSEHQHAHAHQHEQQPKVLPAGSDSVSNGLESHWPPCQLKDPHDPGNSEHLENKTKSPLDEIEVYCVSINFDSLILMSHYWILYEK